MCAMRFNEANEYAARIDAQDLDENGKKAGTYPRRTKNELNVLFNNRAAIGDLS